MMNTCVIANCKTGLNKKWITFVYRKDWTPTQHDGIFIFWHLRDQGFNV